MEVVCTGAGSCALIRYVNLYTRYSARSTSKRTWDASYSIGSSLAKQQRSPRLYTLTFSPVLFPSCVWEGFNIAPIKGSSLIMPEMLFDLPQSTRIVRAAPTLESIR